MDWDGKRVLVTGGAVRIGRAFSEAFLARGAEVVVHYQRSRAEAEALSDWTVCAELGDERAVNRMMDEVGEIDVLVNNASLFTRDRLQAATPERVARELRGNLLAPPEWRRRLAVQGNGGAVLHLLDRRIEAHDTSCVPYTLSKVGLAELTRLAALELAPDFRVNAVAPGPVLPAPSCSEAEFHERKGVIPMERVPEVDEVVQAGLFLLENASITGQVVFVDGGQHLLGNGV